MHVCGHPVARGVHPPSLSLTQFPNYLTVVEEPDGKDYPSYHLIDWFWRSAIITPMAADATLLLCGAGRLQGGHTGRWLDINRIIFAYASDENLETIEASTRTAIGDVVPDRLSKTLAHAARQALNDGSPAWLPAAQGIWRQQLEDKARREKTAQDTEQARKEALEEKERRRAEKAKDWEERKAREQAEKEAKRQEKAKARAKKRPGMEYLREMSEEDSAAWRKALQETEQRKRKRHAEQSEEELAAAAAEEARSEQYEPPAEWPALQHTETEESSLLEGMPPATSSRTALFPVAGLEPAPSEVTEEDVASTGSEGSLMPPRVRPTIPFGGIAGLQARLEAAQAPPSPESAAPPPPPPKPGSRRPAAGLRKPAP